MKKAYVKPVFLAEKFVAEQNYAAKGCGTWAWDKAQIQPGMELCYKEKRVNTSRMDTKLATATRSLTHTVTITICITGIMLEEL